MSRTRPCFFRIALAAALVRAAWTLPARAQEQPGATNVPVYTLEDCIRIGLERSTPLANARRGERIADARIRQVRAQVWPQLDVNGTYTRLDEAPVLDEESGLEGRADNYEAGAAASQLLYSGGAVGAALRAARHYRVYATHDTARARNELVRDITRLFYDVLYAREAVHVAAGSVDQLEQFAEQTRLKYEHKTVSEFDWLSARVKLANERPRLVQARNRHALAKAALRDLIYLDDTDFELQGETGFVPVEPDLETLYEEGPRRRPELAQARKLVDLRSEDIRVTRGGYFPAVRAFANYKGTNPGADEPAEDAWAWSWNAGLTASWSILDGGLRRATMLEKVLNREKARADLDDLRRKVRLEIQSAYLTLNDAREVVTGSRDNVDLARKALEIARVRYDQGLATYLELADSNLALSSAQLIYLEALRGYLQALADLEYACGGRSLADLEEREP